MKQLIFITVLLLGNFSIFSQSINVFHEATQNGYIFYGTNKEFYPVSVSLDFDLTNMKFSEEAGKILVIPARSDKFKFGGLSVENPSKTFKFNYKYKTAIGNITLDNKKPSFDYQLPFEKDKSFKIFQGYNGSFSHKSENALDFMMPEGTKVWAAREGIIVEIVQRNTESCPKEECKKYNNYVTIMHADGTFASYVHIQQNSVKLKLGDNVKSGEVIANSGNVGYSSGPHLHFVCFVGGFDKRETLPTKFKIDNGERSDFLKEGMIYSRAY